MVHNCVTSLLERQNFEWIVEHAMFSEMSKAKVIMPGKGREMRVDFSAHGLKFWFYKIFCEP